jgi:hypothetical protein
MDCFLEVKAMGYLAVVGTKYPAISEKRLPVDWLANFFQNMASDFYFQRHSILVHPTKLQDH